MKYSWMIFLFLGLSGCEESEYRKELKIQIEKTTISSSYYLTTIVHDEHLFLTHNFSGYFTHHPNCPCLQNKPVEKISQPMPPIIIDFNKK